MYHEIFRFENEGKLIRLASIAGKAVILVNDLAEHGEAVDIVIPYADLTRLAQACLEAWEHILIVHN